MKNHVQVKKHPTGKTSENQGVIEVDSIDRHLYVSVTTTWAI